MFQLLVLTFVIYHLLCACDVDCPPDKPFCSEVGCISQCPEPFYINDTDCVTDCGNWFVSSDRKCVKSCPNDTYSKEILRVVYCRQYLERLCTACSGNSEFVMNSTCVIACPNGRRVLDSHHCMDQCSSARPFKISKKVLGILHYVCVDKCPHFEENGICVNKCSEGKVMLNSSCLHACPPSDPVLLSNKCLQECPFTLLTTGTMNSTCVYQCPANRPLVSHNQCVNKCPESAKFKSLKNGTSLCVHECEKDFYIHNGTCVGICPSSTVAGNGRCSRSCPGKHFFTCMVKKGNVCGAYPNEILDHKICVNICPEHMFIFNRACVFSCPYGMPVFNKECSDICPVDSPFILNNTISRSCSYTGGCSEVLYLRCISKCPNDTYIYSNQCLSYCPNDTFYDEHRCVQQCPLSKGLKQTSSITYTIWNRQKFYFTKVQKSRTIYKCVATCSVGSVKLQSRCLRSCPDEYRFVKNMSCTRDSCSTQLRYRNKTGVFCLDHCEFSFEYNSTCVDSCPLSYYVYNQKCVKKCPETQPYTFQSVNKISCNKHTGKCSAEKEVTMCVSKCPNNSFVQNNSCVKFCPKPLLTDEDKCVEYCPNNTNLIDNALINVTYWKQSPFSKQLKSEIRRISTFLCVSFCPYEKALVDGVCEATCPAYLRYVYQGHCTKGPCNTTLKFHSPLGIVCANACPLDKYEYNKTCVFPCPRGYFSLHQQCVTECDTERWVVDKRAYVDNTHRCYSHDDKPCTTELNHDMQCRDYCHEDKFLWGRTCLDLCPDGAFTFNKTCVMKCPESHKFINKTNVKFAKWYYDTYLRGYYYFLNVQPLLKECVNHCSIYTSGDICVKECPSFNPYLIENICKSSCPSDKLNNFRDKTCVTKCPDELIRSRDTCRINCESDKLYKDGECIDQDECTDPMFAFDGECVNDCPDGYLWFHSCVNVLAVSLSIPVLLIPTSAFVIFGWQTVCDFRTIIALTLKTEGKFHTFLHMKHRCPTEKNHKKLPKTQEGVLLLEDIDNDTETELTLTRNMMETETAL